MTSLLAGDGIGRWFCCRMGMVVALATMGAVSVAQAVEPQVGLAGDIARWQVHGAQTVPADQVRAALKRDPYVQVATTPSQPVAQLLRVVERRLTLGYASHGMPETEVRADYDARRERIDIHVSEGRQYLAGTFRIEGAEGVDTDRIVRSLTTSTPPELKFTGTIGRDGRTMIVSGWKRSVVKGKPNWRSGVPARFDDRYHRMTERMVLLRFQSQGRFWPTFTLGFDRDETAGTADAVVRVTDVGPKARLGRLVVGGLERHTPTEVRAYLKLEEGMALDGRAILRMHRQLWASGRFLKHAVTARPREEDDRVDLTIELLECPGVSLLNEPLGEAEQLLLAARDWLDQTDQSIVISADGFLPRARMIIDRRLGFLGEVRLAEGSPLWALSADQDGLRWFLPEDGVAWFLPLPRAAVSLEASMGPSPNIRPPLADSPLTQVVLGAGVFGRSEEEVLPPVEAEFDFAPVAFMMAASHPDSRTEVVDGELIARRHANEVRVDVATRRLVSMRLGDVETGSHATFVLQDDHYRQRLAELRGATRVVREAELAETISALATAGLRGFGDRSESDPMSEAQTQTLHRAIRALLTEEAGQALARWARDVLGRFGKDKFSLPIDAEALLLNQRPVSELLLFGLVFSDDLWPRDAWTWAATRQAILIPSGQTQTLQGELRRLYTSDATGPVGFLVCSHLMQRFDASLGRLLAKRGLSRLDDDHLTADARALFGRDGALSAAIGASLRATRQWTADERAAMKRTLGDPVMKWLEALVELAVAAERLEKQDTADASPVTFSGRIKAQLREALSQQAGVEDTGGI